MSSTGDAATSTEEEIRVVTNFLQVSAIGCKRIHVYLVEITNKDAYEDNDSSDGPGAHEQVREPAVRSSVFAKAVAGTADEHLLFDGREYAYCASKMHKTWDGKELRRDVDGSDDIPGRFHVVLRVHRKYDTALVERFCNGDASVPQPVVQGFLFTLDTILRYALRPWLQCVGGRYLSQHAAITTDAGFDIWWEYRLAMHPTHSRLLLNVSARAVPVTSGGIKTLGDLSDLFFDRNSNSIASGPAKTDGEWAKFESCVHGLSVLIPGASQAGGVRVAGLATKHTRELQIDGLPVAEHYRRVHGIDVPATSERCAVTDKDVLVPLELCVLEGRQVLPQLSKRQRGRLMPLSALPPPQRLELLRHGAQLVMQACRESQVLGPFKIQVGDELATAPAHVLPAPQMQLRRAAAAVSAASGAWELDGQQVLEGVQVRSWTVLVLASAQAVGESQARAFAVQLVKAGGEMGIEFAQRVPPIVYGSVQSVEQAVESACAAAQRVAVGNERAQLVVCVLPSAAAALYGEIKRVALTRVGVHTQCVLAANARGHRPRLVRGILLKINTKLGGSTASTRQTAADTVSPLDEEPTMVISADVTHTTEARGMSVAAVVWSVDLHARRFAGQAIQHPHRMEIIENMDVVVRHCLRVFFARTGRKPSRILYYRDGVNDSQLPAVRDVELVGIRRGCSLVDPAYSPAIAMVVARKRHHSRFMQDTTNCRPGTLIDAMVGPLAGEGGFHLLAHRSIHGVSLPVYYLVLERGGLDIALLRQLTYHLCYSYPIYTRPATMPAPLYYAHRLAARGRLQLSQRFDALPCFATTRADAKKTNRAAKALPAPHLVPVHASIENTMYFM